MESKDIEIIPVGCYISNCEENKYWIENVEKYRKMIFDRKAEGELDNASNYPLQELLKCVAIQCFSLYEKRILNGEDAHFFCIYDKEYREKHGHNPTFDLLEALYVINDKILKEVKYE